VAVTPQLTTKLRVAPEANEVSVSPPLSRLGYGPAPGQTPVPVAVQLGTVQLSPLVGVSSTIAPLAAAGPEFTNVTV
jgi:hypothetical protein